MTQSFDWQETLALAQHNDALANELLSLLQGTLETHRNVFQAALAEDDHAMMQREAHKLYGACCYVGVPKLRQLTAAADQLEITEESTLVELTHQIIAEIDHLLSEVFNEQS